MSSRPSWLFVHSSDELYGADRVLLDVLQALPDDIRSQCLVWLPNDLTHGQFPLCEQLDALGVANEHTSLPIIRRANLNPSGLARLSRKAKAFRSAVRELAPEVVYGTTSATLPGLAAIGKGPRIIFHNQEIWRTKEAKLLGRLAKRADSIIANSTATKEAQPRYLDSKTVVVPNTTLDQQTLSEYVPLASLPKQPLRFGSAGRWTPTKGLDVLLEAWEIASPGQLQVAGGPPPSGAALDLETQLQALPNADSVTLLGELRSLNKVINESHVIVMPSRLPESFGLVALEAMSAGRPAIASRIGGLENVVTDDVGWLVEPGNAADLASALQSVTYDSLIAKGTNARSRFEKDFAPARFVQNWRAAVGLNGL